MFFFNDTVLKSEHDACIIEKDAEYAELAKKCHVKNEQCMSLADECASHQRTIKSLNASLKKEKTRNDTLDSKTLRLNGKIAKLSKYKKSYMDTAASQSALEKECKAQVVRITELTETINAKDKEMAELNRRLTLMENTVQTMQHLNMRVQSHEYKADVQAAAQKAVMTYIGNKRSRLE